MYPSPELRLALMRIRSSGPTTSEVVQSPEPTLTDKIATRQPEDEGPARMGSPGPAWGPAGSYEHDQSGLIG